MDHFNDIDGALYAEDVSLNTIADAYGTPCYVYSRATLERHWRAFDQALSDRDHLICYAVKANSNLAILQLLARLGSGFDVVSGGELSRVLKAGGDPEKVVFSGVGKQKHELEQALAANIHSFNVESMAELEQLQAVAKQKNKIAPISVRINPDVDPNTHPYIATGLRESKFGVDTEQALDLYLCAAGLSHLKVVGIDCHIGSQITELQPFLDALDRVLRLIDRLESHSIHIQHLNLGGGLGVQYQDEQPPHPSEFALAVGQKLRGRKLRLILEPGRAIAANAGVLLTRVILLKQNHEHHFAVVDAAMNDLLRPALYQAWHRIVPVTRESKAIERAYHIVGPVCESSDCFGQSRSLALATGDLLAIRTAGAYGFTMASNYNTRPRVAEVLVDNGHHHLIRRRETLPEMLAAEQLL